MHHPHHPPFGGRRHFARPGRGPRGAEHGPALDTRGGRRRVFEPGELRLVLLWLVAEAPRHGYDLIREMEARSGGAYAPSPGVVYPTLTLLLDMGLAEEAAGEGARKVAAATEAGRQHLAERAAEVEAALARLTALAQVQERTDATPIRRAMQNLKAALHGRFSQDGADRALILDAAALIDEAARKIERL
ncbi:PadR family transcriptional regulator [Rubellimicrobium aerolatum]|uniref:PadR family transcriptional regulator n=1 Tax=Rubellimicrobium aerolatum TaxID=490979 RepID=A0ABW0SCD8_9RHOB|nr:PadR family transcriptional regulator [Rubellimicrobium aerolatum]MBP1806354.1 DNA-binding PadR family transcriptional regulator [Rubellimicrobium aerolatum]